MERQAEISARQVKIIEESERPLVLVQTFHWQIEGWSHQAEKNVFPAIVISLANFGAGVALADFCQIGMFIGVKPPEKHELFGEFRMAVMHDENGNVRRHFYENVYLIRRGLMPHLDHWEIRLKDIKLTPAQVDELSTGHQKAWVDAEVFYTDIRGAKRTTCFRYLYDRQADMFTPDHSLPNFNRHA